MSTRLLLLVVLVALMVAGPVAAETYTITLANGTEFQTRYRPKAAGWDESKIMVLTDVGNWIAIPRADVMSVVSDTENKGFGKIIDTSTIAIGWSPNDAPDQSPEEAMDPMTRLINYLAGQDQDRPDYSVQQFVEPGDAGQGGLPVSGLTPPGTGVSNVFGVGETAFPVRQGGNTPVEPDPIDQ